MTTKQRYPLSSTNGQAIPLDILRPAGLFTFDFISTSASTPTALPAEAGLLLLRTTADCFIKFANSAVIKPDGLGTLLLDTLYLEVGDIQAVAPSYLYYSVIGNTLGGTLTVQILETWAGLGLETQYQYK